MTAIYLMWDNNGFALAADSNQTAAANNQTWVDSVEKIISIEGHQIAFGASGNASLEGVEVNEIIRSWARHLPAKHFATFDEYIVNFLQYFASTDLPHAGSYEDSSKSDYFKQELLVLRELLEEFEGDIDQVITKRLDHLSSSVYYLNVYGSYWDDLNDIDDHLETVDSRTLSKIRRIESIRNRTIENIDLEKFRMYAHDRFHNRFDALITNNFREVFGREFDVESELDKTLANLSTVNLENKLNFNSPIDFLFTGYGESEWIPSAVKLKIVPSVLGTPRVGIAQIATPITDWYVSLAIDSGVNSLTRGFGGYSRTKLIELARPHLKKNHEAEFDSSLSESGMEQFENAMGKIDSLTLSRLEYVARLFVQIEALQSYLNEPVPGVGGDTRVISMTKNTKSEKLIQEMP